MATVAVASVLTSVVAATDSTTAKTMSNIAGLAIFDVSDVPATSGTATAFSLLRNHYCSC